MLVGMSKPLLIVLDLDLPRSCREILAGLDPGLKGVRWLPAEQMYLTLSFLDVEPGDEVRLRQALDGVRVPAVTVRHSVLVVSTHCIQY